MIEGFTEGFDLGYTGSPENIHLDNLISAQNRPEILSKLIEKEVSRSRFLGPFARLPFSTMRINPLGLVPKRTPGAYRLITDLSQPSDNSVNSSISREKSSVKYPSIQEAIYVILDLHSKGHKPYLFKMDIESAFRITPLAPSNFPLMGARFEGQFFIDAFLPMGASTSCRIFQEFSDAFAYIIQNSATNLQVKNYLDDYLGISINEEQAHSDMAVTERIGEELQTSFVPDKTEGPARVLTFTGFELDCERLEARLPQDKLDKAKKIIDKILHNKRVPTKWLVTAWLPKFLCPGDPSGTCFHAGVI